VLYRLIYYLAKIVCDLQTPATAEIDRLFQKLWISRSRLYQHKIDQWNDHWKALCNIYPTHTIWQKTNLIRSQNMSTICIETFSKCYIFWKFPSYQCHKRFLIAFSM